MTDWVYQTDDFGKTITRRVLGKYESSYPDQVICISPTVYMTKHDMTNIARQLIKQQNYRHDYPVLNSLWEQYHTMLKLVADGGSNEWDI